MFEEIRTNELIAERIEYENSFICLTDIQKSEEMDFQIKEHESFLYAQRIYEEDSIIKLRDDELIAERLEYEKNLSDFFATEEPLDMICEPYPEMMDIQYDDYLCEQDDYYFEEINMDAAYCGSSLRGYVVSDDPFDTFTECDYPEGPNENIEGFRYPEPQYECFEVQEYEPDYECFEMPDFEEECYYENISEKEELYLKNLIKDHLNEEMKFQNFLKDSEVCDELKLQFESEDIILC